MNNPFEGNEDKVKHFVAGAVIALVSGFFISPLFAIGLALAAGVGKEIYDQATDGDVSTADILATGAGGVIGAMVHFIF